MNLRVVVLSRHAFLVIATATRHFATQRQVTILLLYKYVLYRIIFHLEIYNYLTVHQIYYIKTLILYNLGRCICQHNTAGDNCDRCAKGYYGNALQGTALDCKLCPCPNKGSCVLIGEDTVICLECPKGYGGKSMVYFILNKTKMAHFIHLENHSLL